MYHGTDMLRSRIGLTLLIFGALWTISEAGVRSAPSGEHGAITKPVGGNILLLVADDVGVDKIHAYGEHPETPHTPNIDALAARGVLFRNAYSAPTCSPARANMLTGRFGRRIGLGVRISVRRESFKLPLETLTIPRVLDRSTYFEYDHALAGKWHLASLDSPNVLDHPRAIGFRRHAGSVANLNMAFAPDEQRRDYYHWEKITDGVSSYSNRYATTVTVDDALVFAETMAEPWFLMVSFNAPHVPRHAPPESLHSRSTDELTSDVAQYYAMVEAMDTEIGRLLSGIEPSALANTTVLFVGDNGTARYASVPPSDPERAKGTLFEGGTNVPLIVAGPVVTEAGSESAALVHVVDIFATAADLAGVQLDRLLDPNGDRLVIDGRTLLPCLRSPQDCTPRDYLYTEQFMENGKPPYRRDERAVRDRRWKLIRQKTSPEEFYDLEGRRDDGPNLLDEPLDEEALAAYKRLTTELDRLTEEIVYVGY